MSKPNEQLGINIDEHLKKELIFRIGTVHSVSDVTHFY